MVTAIYRNEDGDFELGGAGEVRSYFFLKKRMNDLETKCR
jgi:hypothetical protein